MNENEIFEMLENLLGSATSQPDRNGDAVFRCPNCNHNKPHLVVNVKSGLYHCWICEFGGNGHKKSLYRLGFKSESQLFSNGLVLTAESFTVDGIRNLFAKYGSISKENHYEVEIPKGYGQLYFNRKSAEYKSGYLYLIRTRGLSDNDIMKFNIHYNPSTRCVLIPSYDKNFVLNYYVARYIDRKRYDNPQIPKVDFIFNEWLINWNKELLITEGAFDAIKSKRNSAVLLGSSLKKDYKLFRSIIKNRTPVVLALDPDAYKKQCIIAELLRSNDINVKIIDLRESNMDISEMGVEEFNKKIPIQFGLKQFVESKFVKRRTA